jgi:hypothetical protein
MIDDFHVRVIRDLSGVEEIRPVWTSWHQHPNSDIDFYQTVIRSMPGVLRPHILVLYQGGVPQAMLIGRLEHTRMNLRIGYLNLFKARARSITFIYQGFLGETSPRNAELLLAEIIHSLNTKEADAAFLSNVSLDSPLYGLGRKLPGFLERDHALTANMHRSMPLPGSAEEVYRGLSGKVRKNLKWQAKKLVNDFSGTARIRTFRETAELEEMIRDIEQVAKKTYQRGLAVGFIDSAETRERLRLEAEKGWLRSFVLYVADKPCAFWKGTLYQETFYSDSMGYDPDYAKYSPGMYLIMKVIEDFCEAKHEERPRRIDFGFGDAQYKAVLADREWHESSVYMFAPTLRGVGLNLFRTQTELVNQLANGILSKGSLLLRAKRIWRDRLRRN